MNKTDFTSLGGFPVTLDDFTYEQNSVREALKGLMSGFGINAGDDFIISGCDTYNIGFNQFYNAGYIFFKGEIYKVDGGAVSTLAIGQSRVWVEDITYDAVGDKTLENSNTVHAYHIRKVKMASAVYNASIHALVSSTVTLQDKILDIVAGEDWIDVPGSTAKYRKDKLGFVHLAGMIGQNNITTFTLPVGYRPATNQTFRVFWIDNPNSSYTNLTISTAGVVTAAIFTGAGTDIEVSISGISFKHA